MKGLVEIRNLVKQFPVQRGIWSEHLTVHALQGIDLIIPKGETVGLVGESGCGKSTLGRCILRLIEPTAGQIHFNGIDITHLEQKALLPFRKRMQIIFQDPFSSLNPRLTVGNLLEEPLTIHRIAHSAMDRESRIARLLDLVGLPKDCVSRYPHEFSGGQRQRVAVARALAVEPEFIVCDEPVSALDVSIQAQIINLMMDLQKELKLTYLFISHDLKIVQHISDHICVMYLGKIVESAPAAELYKNPKHPYTQALLSAIPQIDASSRKLRILLPGDPPKPTHPPNGCQFHPRCRLAEVQCTQTEPQLENRHGPPTHRVACLMVKG